MSGGGSDRPREVDPAAVDPVAPPHAGDGHLTPPPESETVSPRLLEALVCPASGGRLDYDAERGELISRSAGLAFPIRSGIPIMLIDEARHLDD